MLAGIPRTVVKEHNLPKHKSHNTSHKLLRIKSPLFILHFLDCKSCTFAKKLLTGAYRQELLITTIIITITTTTTSSFRLTDHVTNYLQETHKTRKLLTVAVELSFIQKNYAPNRI